MEHEAVAREAFEVGMAPGADPMGGPAGAAQTAVSAPSRHCVGDCLEAPLSGLCVWSGYLLCWLLVIYLFSVQL